MRFTRSRDVKAAMDVKSAHNIRHVCMAHTLRNPTITTQDHSNGELNAFGHLRQLDELPNQSLGLRGGRWGPKLMPGHDPSDSPVTAVGATKPTAL